MSELQFPKNPVVGQQYDFPPYRYYWDGTKWKTMGIGYNPVNDLRDELEPKVNSNIASVFEALRRSYAEAGLNLINGSFEEGSTLASSSDALLHKASGKAYSWSGSFPKVVNTGSTPATSGGVGSGAWVDRTDDSLRDEIRETVFQNMKRAYAEAGFNLIEGSFQLGGTLSGWPDVLWDWTTGKGYQWHLDEAKNVAAGSTPTNIGVDWVDRSKDTLRSEIPNMPNVIAQRQSINAIPRLLNALATYNEATDPPINIIGLGSSVGVGASLPDPSTQAPVKYLASKLRSSLDVGNIFNIKSYNYSVNGSTISEYSAPLEQSVTDEHTPKLLVLAYGMNDSGVAIFNAGQTYPDIYTNAAKLIRRARELGSDVVIITTPHHRCNTVTYYMPDGVPQLYPAYVAAPVSPESLVPPASQSNITGDFTGSGKQITVSHRHLRVNQMFRRIASDFGCAVIDAEYFWFKALEEYGEDALFNAGEYLHPNLLGHQQSYHAAIDMFIDGLQRQASQGVEPQLFGEIGINTQTPSAVLDIHVPYSSSPKDSLAARARTGALDGLGIKGEGVVWKVEAETGDLVGYQLSRVNSVPIEFYRIHGDVLAGNLVIDSIVITERTHSGNIFRRKSGGVNVSSGTHALYDLSAIAESGTGRVVISGYQNGIGRKHSEFQFIMKSGVITLGEQVSLGDAVFTASASGSLLNIVLAASNTIYSYEIEFRYGY